MGAVTTLPGAFPLHEDRNFISESEWVILKLLCRPLEQLDEADPAELSAACGGQIDIERCDEIIRTVRIAKLEGLGSWIARLLAEVGLDEEQVRKGDAASMLTAINRKLGYPVCNEATVRAFRRLQENWQT